MVDLSLEYHTERFKAFDALPGSVKKKMLTDPQTFNVDWVDGCGLQNCALSLGQTALDMADCQSPIEMLMFLALEKLRHGNGIMDIALQKELVCNGRKYRADFFVTYGDWDLGEIQSGALVVECDGHAFHEKTKEQAAKDKQRDRDMQTEGFAVLRFTGSEIYNNADRCAQEVADYIGRSAKR